MKIKILLGLLVVLVVIQFLRPTRNLGPAEPGPNDITVLYPTPAPVKAILAKACYDCHSDHTRYPWYANVQPVAWWLANHISEGKHHLNFSQFSTYNPKRADHKLEAAIRQVHYDEMPLWTYTSIHRDADLTDAETATLTDWFAGVRQQIAAKK